ncbi:unnamed protein product [Parajaminaea phylloscopi]
MTSHHQAPSRPTVRYDAQESPSEGSRQATNHARSRWVGPFERVLGDHDDAETEQKAGSSGQASGKGDAQKNSSSAKQADSAGAGDPDVRSKPSDAHSPAFAETSSPRRGTFGRSSVRPQPSKPSAAESSALFRQLHRAPDQTPLPTSDSLATSASQTPPSRTARAEEGSKSGPPHEGASDPARQSLAANQNRALASKSSSRSLRSAAATKAAPQAKAASSTAAIRSYRVQEPDQASHTDAASQSADFPASVPTTSGPSYIRVGVRSPQGIVEFNDLYLNHAPGLQPLHLLNTSEDSILIRCESRLGRAVTFMRRRRAGAKNDLSQIAWPTNTLSWAHNNGLSPEKLRDLRTLSGSLEAADALILEGGASTEIFAIVRPSLLPHTSTEGQHARGQAEASPSPSRAVDLVPLPSTQVIHYSQRETENNAADKRSAFLMRDSSSLHPLQWQETAGTLEIKAWRLHGPGQPENDDHSQHGAKSPEQSQSRATSECGASVFSGAVSAFQPGEGEAQVITVPVSLRCCRPQLALHVRQPASARAAENDASYNLLIHRSGYAVVDFGDVTLGRAASTEITLINQSAIDCFWQGRREGSAGAQSVNTTPTLSLVSSGDEELTIVGLTNAGSTYQPHVLGPRQLERMRLTLDCQDASSPGDFEESLTLTNLHDTSNSVRLILRANIVSESPSALSVESGQRLDFGDCCGGQWAKQLLVLRNTSEAALDVNLYAQKGYKVTFEHAHVADESDDYEDISVGATAASSDAAVPDVCSPPSTSSHSERDSAAASDGKVQNLFASAIEAHSTTAMELIRTPTHNASSAGLDGQEPPTYSLQTSPSLEGGDLDRTPLVLQPFAHPPAPLHAAGSDDNDNSSVASQAGSRPGSPAPGSVISGLDCMSQPASDQPDSVAASSLGESERREVAKTKSVLAWRQAHQCGADDDNVRSQVSSVAGELPFREGSLLAESDRAAVSQLKDESKPSAKSKNLMDGDQISVLSEQTSLSLESRSHAVESQRAMSTSSSSRIMRPGGDALSSAPSGASRASGQHQKGEIESLLLRPKEETRVVVSYKPARGDLDEDFSAGRLVENIFRVTVEYCRARSNLHLSGSRNRGNRERKTVLCRTRTCTSLVTVSPSKLDFGEVNVGSRKSSQIVVTNHSDLTARVDLRFVSKVLSMYRDEMAIPSRQSVHLTVDYSPRRVNTSYSKQITVANLLNRHNDQVIDVSGRNIDKQRISFHSLFYRILTPHGSNFLEFGDVNINSSRIRTFAIENTSQAPLTLDISAAHTEDLSLYVKSESQESSAPARTASFPKVPAATATFGKSHSSDRSAAGQAHKATLSTVQGSMDGDATGTSKRIQLKERFLDSLTSDVPASVRQENASWRTAQKLSHFRQGIAPTAAVGSSKEGQVSSSSKAKSAVNMSAALRKGGKGRTTHRYGKSATYRDRSILQDTEWIDLATGPPLVAKRISVKSKCFQMLEQIEAGDKHNGKFNRDAGEDNVGDAPAAPAQDAQDDVLSGAATERGSPPQEPQPPSTPVPRLPSPLAKDIVSRAGSPSRSLARAKIAGASEAAKRSPALTGRKKIRQNLPDPTDVSDMTIDELTAALEAQVNTLSTLFFNSPQAEEKHVRTEINLQRELKSAVQAGRLSPLGWLRIPPGEERQVIAVWCPNGSTRPHIQGTARKQDSRIFLKLIDYDVDAVIRSSEFNQMSKLDKEELPIRDLMVRGIACRALLELGQPHINFGQMEKGETKVRKILIHNRSEWAQSYCIRKSGSIASGDIKLHSGRYGVVPAHGKREIEFVFSPSLTGPFNEKLVIENVADRDQDLTVFLKATVHKRPNFSIEPATVDFGECRPGKLTDTQFITVSNTTSKARTFVVAVDAHDLRHQRTIMDLVFSTASESEGKAALSHAEATSIAEEIEHISQKLKIASRKGQDEKIKKYEERLSELAGKKGEVAGSHSRSSTTAGDDSAQSTFEQANEAQGEGAALENGSVSVPPLTSQPLQSPLVAMRERNLDPARLKRVSSTVTVGVAPNSSKRIALRLRTSAVHTAIVQSATLDAGQQLPKEQRAEGEDVSVSVRIHELKNQDETRVVSVKARALWAGSSSLLETVEGGATRPDQESGLGITTADVGGDAFVVAGQLSSSPPQSAVESLAGHEDRPDAQPGATPSTTLSSACTTPSLTGEPDSAADGDGEVSVDPLPMDNGASIVFSADSSWA